MTGWRWIGRAALVACAATVAGCAEDVPGSAVADPVAVAEIEERRPLPAEDALGDLTTIDTCSYLDADAFSEVGSVLGEARPSFDACTVTVRVGERNLDARIGRLVPRRTADAVPDPRKEEGPRGLLIMGSPGDFGDCRKYLAFEEGRGDVLVEVQALDTWSERSSSALRDALCDVADAAVESVRDTVAAGAVRHWDLAANSLGAVDACQVIDAAGVVAAVQEARLRIDRSVADRFPAKHQCRWGDAGAQPHVLLYFHVGELAAGAGTTEETIAGRRTIVLTAPPAGDVAFCVADTPHVPFGQSNSTEPEVASILVALPTGAGDPCAAARRLAGEIWPRLPAV